MVRYLRKIIVVLYFIKNIFDNITNNKEIKINNLMINNNL